MKTFRYVCAVLALLLVLAAFPVVSATAAGVSVKGPGTVKVGDTFSVKVTFSGEKIMGVDAGLSYDSSVVAFQSGNGASAGKIVLYSDGTGKTLGTTLTFKAVAAGSTSVSVRINECYDADLASLGGGSGSTKVTVSDGTEATKAPDATKKPSADKTPQKTKDKSTPKPTATPVPVDQREMKSELSGDVVYVWHVIPKGVESPQEGLEKTRIPFGEETVEAFVRKTDGMQLVYVTDAKGDEGSLVMLREKTLQPYCPFIGREAQITLLELPEEHPEGFEEVTWNVDADHAWPALRMQDKPDLYLFYALGLTGRQDGSCTIICWAA